MGGGVGAIANFVGLVRNENLEADTANREIRLLTIEHYPGMTERSIAAIVESAGERWPLDDVVIIHRVGELAALEQIVFVQVASGHRAAAFAACEFLMDYLKTEAVFWKRELTSNGSTWLEATAEDGHRARAWNEAAPPREN